MTDLPGADADAAAIHNAFAKWVRYTGAGLTSGRILAVRSHLPADQFMGGGSVRELCFELRKADLPGDPDNGDVLIENDGAGAIHNVIEVTDRDDVDGWLVKVELA
ncbi:MAG: hypothetical protein KBO59_23990 [Achromobacter sp.]|nr:hypothetical protein [Achromobacter sp.]